jgi:outer membrane protein assembly factor BamE (lipoprotein component of BamABCDE complex)
VRISVLSRACLLLAIGVLSGCQSAADHAASVQAASQGEGRMTLGTVQRQIRIGMASADVAEILGAPNMVTTDEQRREVWVWDKIATDRAYSQSVGGVNALFLGAASAAGASSTSQRTLTVIVKFDEAGKVRDFAYRSSSF